MTRALTAFLVSFAVSLAALPPGLWSLCIDRQGHVAVEPAGLDCHAEGDGDAACRTTECDSCQDYELGGRVLRTKAPDLPTPVALPAANGDLLVTAPLATHAQTPDAARVIFPPRELVPILRC